MARSLGPRLPPALVERLSQRDLAARLGVALPFVTVDRAGRPHAMLLSYLEVRAYDPGTVGLVIQARSTSARNLAERQAGTLLILEPDSVAYVKTRAVDGPLEVAGAEEAGLGYFLLGVEDVLEDVAAEWEGGMRITGAVTYAPPPALDAAWARATLAALAAPRARA
ncbi:MAG TPA: pyridoxamine 5'-phosphate oxidase family protein [Patescibacteria group bacterium]|nr:pyridoxamine 5'-phosphate oxidase family protein [Patescibacteria group bacterium]